MIFFPWNTILTSPWLVKLVVCFLGTMPDSLFLVLRVSFSIFSDPTKPQDKVLDLIFEVFYSKSVFSSLLFNSSFLYSLEMGFLHLCWLGFSSHGSWRTNMNVKVLPIYQVESHCMKPPKCSTKSLEMLRPRPIPCVLISFVVSMNPNIVKSFFISSYCIPTPWSIIETIKISESSFIDSMPWAPGNSDKTWILSWFWTI